MKNKIITAVLVLLFMSLKGFSQDTAHVHNKKQAASYQYNASKNSDTSISQIKQHKKITKKHIYRDTRLGSSTKKYNTYKKNDNGDGAVTNNPDK